MRFSLFFSTISTLLSSTILYAQDCVKPKIYGHSAECLFENRAVIHTYQGYGFADETGKIVIPMQYDKVWHFKNGLAKVERNKRYGLIDKSGKIIIPPQYNELNYFTDKLLRTRHNNQYELFDTQGNIISDKYDFIGNIDYGFAKIKQKDKYGLMDKNGNEIIPCQYDDILTLTKEPDLIAVKKDNQWGFVDKNNHTVIPFVYEQVWHFHNGLAKIRNNQQYGMIDLTGKIIIPTQYQWLDDINEQGLIRFQQNNQFGFINRDNQIVIPNQYEYIEQFNHDIAKAKKNGFWGFIDKTGKEVFALKYENMRDISPFLSIAADKDSKGYTIAILLNKKNKTAKTYRRIEKFYGGLAKVIDVNNIQQIGFINEIGEEVIPVQYDERILADRDGHFQNGFLQLEQYKENKPKYGLMDKTGKIIIPIDYDYRISTQYLANGLSRIEKDKKFGFVDKTGKIVVPIEYDGVGQFENGLAEIVKNKQSALINQKGEIVFPFSDYDIRNILNENRIHVYKNHKHGIIDLQGDIILPIEYDEIFDFEDSLATVKKNEKNGVVDLDGRIIVPIIYDISIHPFKNGLAEVREDWKRGLVNLSGEIVLPIEYHRIGDFKNGFAVIEHPSGDGVIDQKLNFILPPEYSGIDFFKNGLAQISIKGNSHWGDLNHRGQVVIGGVAYDRVEPFNNGVAKIYKGNKAWRVDYSGQVFGIPDENKQQKENNQAKDKEYLNHLKEIKQFRKSNQ